MHMKKKLRIFYLNGALDNYVLNIVLYCDPNINLMFCHITKIKE